MAMCPRARGASVDVDTLSDLFVNSSAMKLIAFLFVFNVGITFAEAIWDWITGQGRRWKDTSANVVIFLFNSLAEKTAFGAIFFVGLLPFYYYASPIELPMTLATWVAAVVAADLSYYFMHRVEHKYRLLWAHHSVHHSSEDFNLSVSFRLCVLEGAIEWIFLIPMVLVGFNPFQAIVAFVLIAQYQTWVHTVHVGRMKYLDGILNTPSAHRVHHGSNPEYLDKNFGGILMIWDRLFGTYQREVEPVVYGLTRNIGTDNPLAITFFEYGALLRETRKKKRVRQKLNVLIGKLSDQSSPGSAR